MSSHWSKITLATCLIFLVGSLKAQQATQMSLEEAIAYGLNHSNTLKNAQLNITNAEQQVVEQRAIGMPKLDAGINYQRYLEVPKQPLPDAFVDFIEIVNPGAEVEKEASFFLKNNLNASINLDAMIFDGVFFDGLRAAKAFKTYTRQEHVTKQREVRNEVTDAYLPVLLIQENIELLDKNIINLEKLLNETKELYKAGFTEQLDVDRQALSLSNLQVNRENLVRQKETAMTGLKFVMGYPIDEPLVITDDLEEMSLEIAEEGLTGNINYNNRPEYDLINQGILLNELNIKLNKSAFLPTLRAFGAYQYAYQGDDFSNGFWAPQAYVGLNLKVPIFDGLQKKARVQQAKLDLELAKIQKNDLERAITTEVKTSRINYLSAQSRLVHQAQNLQLAERIYNTTQIKYREGVGSSLEVTQAEQSLYNSQSNHLQALYDLLVAKSDLDQALGNRN